MSNKKMMSVNLKKIGARTSVNRLVRENYRDKKNAQDYDDGHRMIDTDKTAENVYLIPPPENYDQLRRDRIDWVNTERAKRVDVGLRLSKNIEQLKKSGDLKAEKNREKSQTRKLRSDTVDTIGIVVQMPPGMMSVWTRDQQNRFFSDCLDYMRQHPEEYGHIDTAVIHYDENSPHMQCLASAIDTETLSSHAGRIVGNKTKMSNRQTHIVDAMRAKGWDVDRGVQRINNPEYRNFLDDMEQIGVEVNRHNDDVLLQVWRNLQNRERDLQAGKEALQVDREAFTAEVARIKAGIKKDRQKASETVTEARRIMDQADRRETRADEILHNALQEQAEAEQSKRELTALIDRAENVIQNAQQAAHDVRAGILSQQKAISHAREVEQAGRELIDALDELTEESQRSKGLVR